MCSEVYFDVFSIVQLYKRNVIFKEEAKLSVSLKIFFFPGYWGALDYNLENKFKATRQIWQPGIYSCLVNQAAIFKKLNILRNSRVLKILLVLEHLNFCDNEPVLNSDEINWKKQPPFGITFSSRTNLENWLQWTYFLFQS